MRSSTLAFSLFSSLALAPLVSLAFAAEARADVSSWMAIGGGYSAQLNRADRASPTRDFAPAFTYSIGVGSSPLASAVFGGLLRTTTMFGLGTDLGLAIRGATGGFARGDWGLALDAGAAWRPWRDGTYGQWPLQIALTAGSPWGLQVALATELSSVAGQTPAQGFFAVVELDLLRFTVTRQGSSEVWWHNPAPAGGHAQN